MLKSNDGELLNRAFDHIFETIQVSEGSKYLVHASYLEIYNEEIRDLLGKDAKAKLELKEHPEKGVYVQGTDVYAYQLLLVKESKDAVLSSLKRRKMSRAL